MDVVSKKVVSSIAANIYGLLLKCRVFNTTFFVMLKYFCIFVYNLKYKDMNILFLDIDGVLKPQYADYERDEFGSGFNPESIVFLNEIIEQTGCKIVLSSTWRSKGLDNIQLLWEVRDIPGEVIGITPIQASDEVISLHQYKYNEADRGFEIQEWIDTHNVERYCIVDDDNDILPIQEKYFVRTDSKIGLTRETTDKIIKILKCII